VEQTVVPAVGAEMPEMGTYDAPMDIQTAPVQPPQPPQPLVMPTFVKFVEGRGIVYFCPIAGCKRACKHGRRAGEFTNSTALIKHLMKRHDIAPRDVYNTYGIC